MKRAIVLSGGGSKGAYQIGVWKALRRLRISYNIVTGTSVGALNAALMTQKTYFKALWLWYNLDFKNVVDVEIVDDFKTKDGKKAIFKTYFKNAINGGMTITNLENTISKAIDVDKIYNSNVDLGIVTIQLKNLKPILLTKSKIKKDKLVDYLIASASCFPAFKKKDIENLSYIDGGMYDNLPINLAIDMGATEVIAVDLEEMGIKRKVKNDKISVTYITPNNDIGSFLIFEKQMARRAIRLGYNDTMKKFNNFDGTKYTFKHGNLNKNFIRYKNNFYLEFNSCFDFSNSNFFEKLIKIAVFKKIINSNGQTIEKDFNKIIEKLGYILEIDDSYIYNINKYNKILIEKFQIVKDSINVDESIKENKFKFLFANKETVKYIYDLMISKNENLNKIALFFPNEFLSALYLKIIMENK